MGADHSGCPHFCDACIEMVDALIGRQQPEEEDEDTMALNDFGDSKVTVKKGTLLEKIKANRETHRAQFLKAQEGYREEVIKTLDRVLAEVRDGRPFQSHQIVGLTMPVEHTRDYDKVIAMLEMCVADEITVTETQFSQYVLDDWGWKQAFVTSNARYSKG